MAVVVAVCERAPVTAEQHGQSGVVGRAVSGTFIALVGQLASQLLRFASTIALARFLPESAFGVNAIVASVTLGLWMVSDIGIPAGIIKSSRDDERFLRTAWTLSLARGAILLVAGCIVGLPAAWFYEEPELAWLMPLGSLMIFFVAAESTLVYAATRSMRIGKVVLLEVVGQAIALGVSISVAIKTGHVIALVAGAGVSGLVKLVLSHTILDGPRMRFAWDTAALAEILSFGRFIFISTLMSYVAVRWDIFALGKLEGMALLGIYGIANQVTSVPHQMSVQATTSVLAPVLADAWRTSPETLRARLELARRAYLPVALLLFLGAATLAPAFFVVAYKKAFHAAGIMAQALMVQAFFDFLQEASTRALLAKGDGRGMALSSTAKLVATIACTVVGLELFGFWGFVWGNAAGGLVGVIVTGLRLRAQGVPLALSRDLAAAAVFLVLLGVSCGVPLLLEDTLGVAVAWTTALSCVLLCGPLAVVVFAQLRAARRALAASAITGSAA